MKNILLLLFISIFISSSVGIKEENFVCFSIFLHVQLMSIYQRFIEELTETMFTNNIILISTESEEDVYSSAGIIMKYLSQINKKVTVVLDEDTLLNIAQKLNSSPAIFFTVGKRSSTFLANVVQFLRKNIQHF